MFTGGTRCNRRVGISCSSEHPRHSLLDSILICLHIHFWRLCRKALASSLHILFFLHYTHFLFLQHFQLWRARSIFTARSSIDWTMREYDDTAASSGLAKGHWEASAAPAFCTVLDRGTAQLEKNRKPTLAYRSIHLCRPLVILTVIGYERSRLQPPQMSVGLAPPGPFLTD